MRILFMGTPDFAVPSLRALAASSHEIVMVVTQPDRPKGRGRTLTAPPVKLAAQELGIPVFQPEKVRDEEALARLEALKPDLLVTAAYGQILPKRLLELPPYGCINVHASLLPRWRGGAPIHRAIIEGDKETGITLMRMTETLDAGDIFAQEAVPITEEDTAGSMHDKLAELGAKLLQETLPQILSGALKGIPQDEQRVTYAPNLTREDERIDWSKSARQIFNQVRGLHPWPVAYTTDSNQKTYKIWRVRVKEEDAVRGEPGTVLGTEEDAILVQAGRGIVAIQEIQPAGKKRMSVEAFLRGTPLVPGTRLGVGSGEGL
jgi:methionyl-tRNA formyltransferase